MNHTKGAIAMYPKQYRKNRNESSNTGKDPHKPKILKKNYHVTAQTAYHITQLALQENTSEGRIIDKLVRNYQASASRY